MKLISKFHDFYDSCLSLGIDETIFFQRETKEIKCEETKTRFYIKDELYSIEHGYWRRKLGEYNINNINVLHFCGKQIPFIKVSIQDCYSTREHISYCYNIKQVEAFISKYCDKSQIEKFYQKDKEYRSKKRYRSSEFEKISKWFIDFTKDETILDDYFKYESPYFLKTKKEIIINPCLSNYEFYKNMGAFETFQEISMFISGVMGGQVPKMIEISDTIRLQKKGFDSVTSFRNMKR